VSTPEVSVVVATHDREPRLAQLLDGLRSQTLPRARFEVVVVDDGSVDGTPALLAAEAGCGDLDLTVIRRARSGGWSAAREDGWRAARAPIVAFTDDDCIPDPEWLEAGLEASATAGEAIVQGATRPNAEEWDDTPPLRRPFTHTIDVRAPDPHRQTCNVFYPRSLLERAGGFDVEAFARIQGEDADLAWRLIEAGAATSWAPRASVRHAINGLGPLGKLRRAAGWDLKVYALHPGLRRAWFTRRFFWKGSHYLLARALAGALLPRRLGALRRPVRAWLTVPYAVHLVERGRVEGGGPALAPYLVVHDLVELAAAARSSWRYRLPML